MIERPKGVDFGILRHPFKDDTASFDGGELFSFTSVDDVLIVKDRLCACMHMDSGRSFWVNRLNLLALPDFLKRQPFHEFWILVKKDSLTTGLPEYLSDPLKMIWRHHNPFRFESIGEARYYMYKYEPAYPMKVMHVKDMK